jgi:hypothetical protein
LVLDLTDAPFLRPLHLQRNEQPIHTTDKVRDARSLKRTAPDLEPEAADLTLESLTDAQL